MSNDNSHSDIFLHWLLLLLRLQAHFPDCTCILWPKKHFQYRFYFYHHSAVWVLLFEQEKKILHSALKHRYTSYNQNQVIFHCINCALLVILRENIMMYQHYRIQDGKLLGLFNVAGVWTCVFFKLVFSFNYGTAFLLISWYMGALIYAEATLFFSDRNSYVDDIV